MPVINLPQDTRWGDVGKGIGGLLGAVAGAYAQSQIQQGVGALLQDTSIAPDKLPGEVFKKFGNPGIETLAKLNALKEQQATITQKLAGAGLATVQAALDQAKLPSEAARAAGVAATAQAQPAHIAAETEQATAQAASIKALQQPTATLRTEEASEAEQRAKQLYLQNQRIQQGGGKLNTDVMTAPYKLSPEEKTKWDQSLTEAYDTAERAKSGSGPAAAESRLRGLATAERASAELPPPTSVRNNAVNAAAWSQAAESFLTAFRKDPSASGLTSGASIVGWLEHQGWPTGDVNQIQMRIAQINSAAQRATTGGGFYSDRRFAVAKDVTAGPQETPLYAIQAMKESVEEKIATLEADKASLTSRQRSEQTDQQLARAYKLKGITDTFYTQVRPVISKTTGKPLPNNWKTTVFFDGKQVDSKSFKTLVANDATTYKIGSENATGTWLFEQAKEKNLDPMTFLELMRANVK